ncbi:hypothetical protein HPP92_013610 [Vanilla planifolia]|uniref:Uncharacterized protein n=1 Tax=Vanilla planifolia TaxID=51239 RepID=A0A835R0K1_VANPL|nr:hypothetical protein HPP92_014048 [Vanilla planifolia]KAG0478891.1 hypothetical protein HPP92_013610 [Vanilla planifolia]
MAGDEDGLKAKGSRARKGARRKKSDADFRSPRSAYRFTDEEGVKKRKRNNLSDRKFNVVGKEIEEAYRERCTDVPSMPKE